MKKHPVEDISSPSFAFVMVAILLSLCAITGFSWEYSKILDLEMQLQAQPQAWEKIVYQTAISTPVIAQETPEDGYSLKDDFIKTKLALGDVYTKLHMTWPDSGAYLEIGKVSDPQNPWTAVNFAYAEPAYNIQSTKTHFFAVLPPTGGQSIQIDATLDPAMITSPTSTSSLDCSLLGHDENALSDGLAETKVSFNGIDFCHSTSVEGGMESSGLDEIFQTIKNGHLLTITITGGFTARYCEVSGTCAQNARVVKDFRDDVTKIMDTVKVAR